jgi:hypothetical protein
MGPRQSGCRKGHGNPNDIEADRRTSAGGTTVKIKTVRPNNHRKAFEVTTRGKQYWFPYAQLQLRPSRQNPVKRVYIEKELGCEGFTYELASGDRDTVHIDHVLDYNRDPGYMKDQLLYRLTLVAQERIKSCSLGKRELIRRLGTSPAQFYRLLDQTNYTKSIGQMMTLLNLLDCEVDFIVKDKQSARPPAAAL